MHSHSARRHPLQSFQFWFLIFAGVAVLAAWKLEFFKIEQASVETFHPLGEPQPTVAKPDSAKASVSLASNVTPGAALIGEEEPLIGESEPAWARDAAPRQEPVARGVMRLAMAEPAGENVQLTAYAPAASGSTGSTELAAAPLAELLDVSAVDISSEIKAADQALASGDDIGAHRMLSTLYWLHPAARDSVQPRLQDLAQRIYFTPGRHYNTQRVVQPGETLSGIARENQVSWEYLAKLNGLSSRDVQTGTALKVIQGPFHAKVELSRRQLTVHAYGYYVAQFPLGIGEDTQPPTGKFQVTEKMSDPTYYGPYGIIDHDDPRNPLGEHWLEVSDSRGTLTGFGIHGTTDAQSIGKSGGPGCLRLTAEDVAELFDLLTLGSEIEIVE